MLRFSVSRCFNVLTVGQGFSKRLLVQNKAGQTISPWHDLDLNAQRPLFPGFIEISRHQLAKYEICLQEEHNPIRQDTRTNKVSGENELRFYGQFPLFNYGCLPQTWENSDENDSRYPYKGDGDPLDIVEIGSAPLTTGSIADVKILGGLCLIDSGEVDWKIICINSQDSLSKKLSTPSDIEKHFPGKIEAIKLWFENIKTYDGKPKNRFEGEVDGPEEALKVIEHAHKQWVRLRNKEIPNKGFWMGN